MSGNIEIAILDSGIAKDIPVFENRITEGINIFQRGNHICLDKNYEDINGHGTACAYTIIRYCSEARFNIVKILDNNGLSSSEVLLEALHMLKGSSVKIINLSISTINAGRMKELKNICEELKKDGKIIVCSLRNGERYSFPAVFDSVIGVEGRCFENDKDYWYNPRKQIQCLTDNTPILYPKCRKGYDIFYGNSKSAAVFTGMLCNIIKDSGAEEMEEVEKFIRLNARRNKWTKADKNRLDIIFDNTSSFEPEKKRKVIEVLRYQTNKYDIPEDVLAACNLMHPKFGFKKTMIVEFLMKIERSFDIELDYEKINGKDFINVGRILEMIKYKTKAGGVK